MTAASNSEARKRLTDPTPHTDPTAAAVRAAQAEAWDEGHQHFRTLLAAKGLTSNLANPYRADRIATDTDAPVAIEGVETVETLAEVRLTWSRCTKALFGRCDDGRMEPWRGGDGHGGTERFYTCDRCGVTS